MIVFFDRHVCITKSDDLFLALRASLYDKLFAALDLPSRLVASHLFFVDAWQFTYLG
jgi:hypothetical protein